MKITCAAFVTLAIAAGSHALFTPRKEDTPCPGAQVVSTKSITASDGKLVELTTFSCDATLHKLAFTPGGPTTPDFPVASPSPTTPAGTTVFPINASPVSSVVSVVSSVVSSVSSAVSSAASSVASSAVSSAASSAASSAVSSVVSSAAAPSSSAAAPSSTDVPAPVANVCAEICQNVCADSGTLPPTTEDCATIVDAITILNGSIAPSFEVDANHVQTLTFGTCRFFFENESPNALSYCWLSMGQVASAAASACLPPVQPINSEGICVAKDGLWRVGVAHS